MKKGHPATQPKDKWYKGGTATTPGGASMKKPKPTTSYMATGRGK